MAINKAILLGNVGKEPDVRRLDSGSNVATFTLATTDRAFTKKDGTTIPERTEWHNIVAFGEGLVKTISMYVHKGTKLYIEGAIHNRTFDKKDGSKGYTSEIIIDKMELLGAPRQVQDDQPQQAAAPNAPAVPDYYTKPADQIDFNQPQKDDLPF